MKAYAVVNLAIDHVIEVPDELNEEQKRMYVCEKADELTQAILSGGSSAHTYDTVWWHSEFFRPADNEQTSVVTCEGQMMMEWFDVG